MSAGQYVPKPAKDGTAVGQPLFERWDGTAWTAVPGPSGASNDEMNGVSCTSNAFCMAVGTNTGPDAPVMSWRGGAWTAMPSPEPSADIEVDLHSVSCTSSDACVAVGSASVRPAHETVAGQGLEGINVVESWDGSTWSLVPSPDPGTWENGLWGVSCTTTGGSMCVAVGDYVDIGTGTTHAVIAVEHDGTWSVAGTVDKVPANASRFYGVSCSSSSQCTAVGFYDANHVDFLLDDNWDGQSWTIVPTAASMGYGIAVSCLAAGNCTEVSPSGKAFAWDGKSWAPIVTPTRTGPSGLPEQSVNGLSCAPGLCVAVGHYVEQGIESSYDEQGCNGVGGGTSSSSDAPELATLTGTGGRGLPTGPPGPAPLDEEAPGAAASSAPSPCALYVQITALDHLPVRTGLAVHPQPYAPSQFPVDFVTGTVGAERCESGCVDLEVTVTNPLTHKAVEGATLNASISGITAVNVVAGHGSVCATNKEGTTNLACGSFLLGDRLNFKTDEDGHAYLRYWAPGVVQPTSTTLRVTARLKCSPTVCVAREEVGAGEKVLPVVPYLIYSHRGSLSEEEAKDIVEWAGGGNAFTKFLEAAKGSPL